MGRRFIITDTSRVMQSEQGSALWNGALYVYMAVLTGENVLYLQPYLSDCRTGPFKR